MRVLGNLLMVFYRYTNKSKEETFSLLETKSEGLLEKEAGVRLLKYGKNEIEGRRLSAFFVFLRQFKSPLIYLLAIAAAVSFFLRELVDGLVIFGILLINGFLGFVQEYKSERVVIKLKEYITPKAKVKREGEERVIERSGLVPGDIVLIKVGDIVPADLRLIETQKLSLDEEVLTGESFPAPKESATLSREEKEIVECKNIAFMGSRVISGEARGVAVATGKSAFVGSVIEKAEALPRKSGFELYVARFSRFILWMMAITLVLVFVINLLVRGLEGVDKFFLFTMALAVGIIPEALPAITTFALSRGSAFLAKNGTVVKRLSAIEDLGNIEILCSDKTGTLTQNLLSVTKIEAENPKNFLLYANLASGHFLKRKGEIIDPFDRALYEKADSRLQKSLSQFKKIWEQPFDPKWRYNVVLVQKNDQKILVARGAPEVIFDLSLKEKRFYEIQKNISLLGRSGHRVLALAVKKMEGGFDPDRDLSNLTYLGFASFFDPLKPSAKEAIIKARQLGIEIKILTGDSAEVSKFVAEKVGVLKKQERVYLGPELDKLSPLDFTRVVLENRVFARCDPVQKYKILKTLQEKRPIGFLGEGINDAPALKLANVGLVVESGADISKEVGDIILLKKDLKVIVDGILKGREIFTNIARYIKYTLIGNFGNYYAMASLALIFPFLPMLPVQILLLNLLSDLPLFVAVSDRLDPSEVKKPKHFDVKDLAFVSIVLGLVSTIFDFIFFAFFFKAGIDFLRTMWFVESILTELVVIFSVRTPRLFIKTAMPSLSLVLMSLFTLGLTLILPLSSLGSIFHFRKPTFFGLLVVLGLIFAYFAATEIVKLIYYGTLNKKKPAKTPAIRIFRNF